MSYLCIMTLILISVSCILVIAKIRIGMFFKALGDTYDGGGKDYDDELEALRNMNPRKKQCEEPANHAS